MCVCIYIYVDIERALKCALNQFHIPSKTILCEKNLDQSVKTFSRRENKHLRYVQKCEKQLFWLLNYIDKKSFWFSISIMIIIDCYKIVLYVFVDIYIYIYASGTKLWTYGSNLKFRSLKMSYILVIHLLFRLKVLFLNDEHGWLFGGGGGLFHNTVI